MSLLTDCLPRHALCYTQYPELFTCTSERICLCILKTEKWCVTAVSFLSGRAWGGFVWYLFSCKPHLHVYIMNCKFQILPKTSSASIIYTNVFLRQKNLVWWTIGDIGRYPVWVVVLNRGLSGVRGGFRHDGLPGGIVLCYPQDYDLGARE